MAYERIIDCNNRTLGYINDRGAEVLFENVNKIPIARYSRSEDATFDDRNIRIGSGNLLRRMFASSPLPD